MAFAFAVVVVGVGFLLGQWDELDEATTSSSTTTSVVRGAGALSASSRLVADGIGPVRVGMTIADAAAAAQVPLTNKYTYTEVECWYASPTGIDGIDFMMSGDRVVRVDVQSPEVTTPSGIAIGASEADVIASYGGHIRTEPHQYVPDGHYLIYEPDDPGLANYRIFFETDGSNVTSMRSGRLPEVAFVEGCS